MNNNKKINQDIGIVLLLNKINICTQYIFYYQNICMKSYNRLTGTGINHDNGIMLQCLLKFVVFKQGKQV